MSQEFVPEDNSSVSAALEQDRPNCDSALPEQEVLCITVTGSPTTVRETINTLYRLGFLPKLGIGVGPSEVQSRGWWGVFGSAAVRDKRRSRPLLNRPNRLRYVRSLFCLQESKGDRAFSTADERTLTRMNQGDRPIQVGSYYHFSEVNDAGEFDRDRCKGMRLDIPAGTAVGFEPGDKREVTGVPFVASGQVYGFNGKINGQLDSVV